LSLAGCAQAPAAPATPVGGAPLLSVGDSWTVHYETDYQAPDSTYHVDSEETLRVNDNDVPTVKVTYSQGDFSSATWYRATDHAVVRQLWEDSYSGVLTEYDPPCPQYKWPLHVGDRESFQCPKTMRSTKTDAAPLTSTQDWEYFVEAVENVTVPAGTFQAYRIGLWDSDYMSGRRVPGMDWQRQEWYAPAACAVVKRQDWVAMGDTETLVSVNCKQPGRID
jgi:hypothetical protein